MYSLTIVPPVDYLYIHNRMSVMLELIQYRFPFSLDAYSNMLQNAVPSAANTNKTLINEYHQTVGLNPTIDFIPLVISSIEYSSRN